MSLKDQFQILLDYFQERCFDYALIGAFALFAYGVTRATDDLDFITRLEYQDPIVAFLESSGFETLHRSEGFSNHWHRSERVKIDLLYVDRSTAEKIFGSLRHRVILGEVELPVVSPEHLVALKLFAARNDPERKFKEFADIKELMRVTEFDEDQVREFFRIYGFESYYKEVVGRDERRRT